MKLLAVDSNSILNRAFYGIKLLTTKDGLFTNGIYGYLNILLKLIGDVQPDAVALAFDLKAPTFRHKKYEGYKAQRKGMPEELAAQLPVLKEILTALGYKLISLEGFEADDILGTLSLTCAEQGGDCVIATGDRDSLQLIGEHVSVLLATTKGGKADYTLYDEAAIQEKYGVSPAEMIDVKALMGDSSDNIPGVAGIGEKGALALITEYHGIDAIYENLETLDIKPGVKKKLADGKDMAYLSRELAVIDRRVPIDARPEAYLRGEVDQEAARALFYRTEMFSMMEKFSVAAGPAPAAVPQPERPAIPLAVDQAFSPGDTVDLYCRFDGDDVTGYALASEGKTAVFTPAYSAFEAQLRTVLTGPCALHTDNSKQLYRWARLHGCQAEGISFDLSLAGYLLSPSSTEYSLHSLAALYAVQPARFEGDTGTVEETFIEELAVFLPLCNLLEEQIEQNDQQALLRDIEIPLAEVLAEMELEGFEIDVDGLLAFGVQLDGQIEELQRGIYELAGNPFNINSPKQMGEILFGQLGLPARKKTKSGYSTNADVLEGLRDKHPIIGPILEYRKLTKLKSTYVEGLHKVVGADGRIHTSFNQTETRTGRISSTEPNLQNIPVRSELGSNLRRFFRAKEGCMLVDADYSQIELRVLAHIADDQNMIDAFLSGEDIHTNTAAQVFNLPPLFVTPLLRSRAKAVNFGIVYGIGAFSLSQDIGVSIAEADDYIKNYLKTYSGVKRYMDTTIAQARELGYVTTLYGRRRYLPELTSSNRITKAFGERVAMNTPIQGSAADIIKIAMVRVYNRLRAENLRSRLILQVHDELIVEAVTDEIDRVKAILTEEMERAAALKVPLSADANVGKTWFEAK